VELADKLDKARELSLPLLENEKKKIKQLLLLHTNLLKKKKLLALNKLNKKN
jgi:hypothetical protein